MRQRGQCQVFREPAETAGRVVEAIGRGLAAFVSFKPPLLCGVIAGVPAPGPRQGTGYVGEVFVKRLRHEYRYKVDERL